MYKNAGKDGKILNMPTYVNNKRMNVLQTSCGSYVNMSVEIIRNVHYENLTYVFSFNYKVKIFFVTS